MADIWYAVFNTTTGELVSVGTEVADDATLARRGCAKVALDAQPDRTMMWDTAAHAFVPRPPPPADDVHVALRDMQTALRDMQTALRSAQDALSRAVDAVGP